MAARRRHIRFGLTAALAAGVVGCVGKVIYNPAPLPAFMKEDVGLNVQPPQSPVYQTSYLTVRDEADDKSVPAVITLPQAIEESIAFNLRVRAGMEKVQAARANLTDAAIIPNPTLQLDSQFVPLPGADPFKQNPGSGPLQYDALVTFPIDWYIFGKRFAAMQAARMGVDVAAADYADLVRKRVAETLDAFYDLLEAKAQLKLSKEDLDDLKRLEKISEDQIKVGGASVIELDRVRLAVLDSQRDYRRRELALATAKSRLRPLVGRTSVDPKFDVAGELGVTGTMPTPSLQDAIALAERNRPDILSDLRDIQRADAALTSEEKKAKPIVNFQTGLSYQQTKFITGLPSERFLNFYLTSTLPFTDRNQGGIAKAQSQLREMRITLHADLAELRAEVEQALETYRSSLATVTADDPATLKIAREVRDKTEAAFKQGGRRLLEVLDAQRAYRERVRASITAQADYWRALNRLNAALGIRFAPSEFPAAEPLKLQVEQK